MMIAAGRKAFTMVEAIVSVAIVGLVLVSALNTVGASRCAEQIISERGRGQLLAQELMAEILQQAYEDPTAGPGSFGVGADEAPPGNRSLYDDVDDYDQWVAAPPQRHDGTVIPGFDNWQQSVTVRWVLPANLAQVVLYDTGIKRICVTISCRGRSVASFVAIRTRAWQDGSSN